MRRPLLWFLLCAALGLSACSGGDSVEDGCKTRDDCPRPDRQICEVATGVCVGFTSPPGAVDGGDDEGVDAGADGG
ncbi:MAG: hypothetical protein ABI333_04985 [bacterium]